MEWTKEQREQAADTVIRKAYAEVQHEDPEFDHEPYIRRDIKRALPGGVGTSVQSDVAIDLQCELTAALDEIERLKSEQMGELAVGGASSENQVERHGQLIRAFVRGAQWWEFEKTGATMWNSDRRLAEDAALKKYPAPPSGEQAAPVDKTRCPYCGWPDEPKNEADNRCGGCGWPVKGMPAGFHAMDCPAAAPVEVQSPKGEV